LSICGNIFEEQREKKDFPSKVLNKTKQKKSIGDYFPTLLLRKRPGWIFQLQRKV